MAQEMDSLSPLLGGDPNDIQSTFYAPEPSDLTGGLPINLDSLRDGPPGSKPFYPYSTLIRYAIKGSPNQKLLLEDIYYAIESRFPYFKTAPSGWKNSVRHNLSLNPCFEKVARPLTDRGKGHYWTVNDTVDPRTGVHRVRKKKTKGGKDIDDGDMEYGHDPTYGDPHAQHYVPDLDAGPSRVAYPPPYPPFDPNFPMIPEGMRFVHPPQPMVPSPADVEVDEHGNVDWRAAWHKELANLQQVTDEHEKAQVNPEWYRMMLFRVRTALLTLSHPSEVMQPGMPTNPGDPQH